MGVIPSGWQAEQQERQNGKCYYCGVKAKLTLEHLIAVKNDGTNAPDNLVLACQSCNSSKGDRPIQVMGLLL